MQIKVVFFASLRELAGVSELSLELSGDVVSALQALASLESHLGKERWGALNAIPFKIAVNQVLTELNQKLEEGDEMALLPQVTGG